MSGGKHHGGAWKVAYADFVTSMMALFLVLWILAMSDEMKKGIADYFRATALLQKNFSEQSMRSYITSMTSKNKQTVREAASSLQSILRRNNNELTDSDEFRFEFMNDGFRIQAMDRSSRPLFESGSSALTDYGRWAMGIIAWEVERYPFRIEVEGHTQGGDPSHEHNINLLKLSSDRAIAAQELMEQNGVRHTQFFRVTGYGDSQPLEPTKPEHELNRRITVVLRLDPNSNSTEVREVFPKP